MKYCETVAASLEQRLLRCTCSSAHPPLEGVGAAILYKVIKKTAFKGDSGDNAAVKHCAVSRKGQHIVASSTLKLHKHDVVSLQILLELCTGCIPLH